MSTDVIKHRGAGAGAETAEGMTMAKAKARVTITIDGERETWRRTAFYCPHCGQQGSVWKETWAAADWNDGPLHLCAACGGCFQGLETGFLGSVMASTVDAIRARTKGSP